MLESLKDYWYLWLILVAVIVLTYLVWKKAIAASRKRHELTYRSMDEMKYWKERQNQYAVLTREKLDGLNDQDTYEAVLANLFSTLESSKDDMATFRSFSDPQKYVYTTWFILEDCVKGSVKKFYVNCGDVLLSLCYESMYAIDEKRLGDVLKRASSCYDVNNEYASFDDKTLEKLDAEFKLAYEKAEFIPKISRYVRENLDSFCSISD